MNKLECIEDIIRKYEDPLQYVDDSPDYTVPVGLPNINLELRSAKVVSLYVLVDVNTSENLFKDVEEAYEALRHAAVQVPEKGGREVHQWIQLYNITEEQKKKLDPLLSILLVKKMSGFPQILPSLDMRPYSKSKQIYRQTEKPVLN